MGAGEGHAGLLAVEQQPFDFAEVYSCAHRSEMANGTLATFVPLEELVEMKRQVARARDLEDIAKLQEVRQASERQPEEPR